MHATLLFTLLALPAAPPQDPTPPRAAAEAPAPVLLHGVQLGDQPVGTWRLDGRIPSFAPLLGPGGIPVTRAVPAPEKDGKPADHPHHVSFWTAHGDVNGVDFWHDPGARIACRSSRREVGEDGSTVLQAELAWIGPDGELVLRESRTLRFHGTDAERLVDRTHVFRAPAERAVVFGDTKEGTFALRLRRELCPDHGATLRNDSGAKGGKAWGQEARWIAYEAEVEGKLLGVACMAHPGNPGGLTRWHARTYGLAAANPFGQRGFLGKDSRADGSKTLPAGESITYRWRTVLYAGPRSDEQLGALQGAWKEQR